MNLDAAIQQAASELVADITRRVVEAVGPRMQKAIGDCQRVGWTEAELAVELGVSEETLARKRKAGDIGCSWAIAPTRFDKKIGRPLNGRPFYMRHHVLSYLLRNETPAKTVGGVKDVTFENVYQFERKEKAA